MDPIAESVKLGVAGVHSGELAPYGIQDYGEWIWRSGTLMPKAESWADRLRSWSRTICVGRRMQPWLPPNWSLTGVHAVIGHICSGATVAALEIYREARIIVISPSATNPALTQTGYYPNFFRTIAPDNRQARAQVDFTLEVLRRNKVAVLHDKGIYGKGLAEYAKTLLEKSNRGTMVLYEAIPPTTIDYSLLAQKINLQPCFSFGPSSALRQQITRLSHRPRRPDPFFSSTHNRCPVGYPERPARKFPRPSRRARR